MPKPMLEFHSPSGPWIAVDGPVDGVWVKMLAEDPDTGEYTRLLRFDAGVNTSAQGIRTHDYWEEVYILKRAGLELIRRAEEKFRLRMPWLGA